MLYHDPYNIFYARGAQNDAPFFSHCAFYSLYLAFYTHILDNLTLIFCNYVSANMRIFFHFSCDR